MQAKWEKYISPLTPFENYKGSASVPHRFIVLTQSVLLMLHRDAGQRK